MRILKLDEILANYSAGHARQTSFSPRSRTTDSLIEIITIHNSQTKQI